ncbi:MAG TPA: VCBS repeat-containing protein [Polyangiaceae bacterium]|nr:VCBS repeat-containing protein [Polyangiaceae bacterium]
MKIRSVITTALATLSLSGVAFAQATAGGAGGASGGTGGTSGGAGTGGTAGYLATAGSAGNGTAGMGATGGALPSVPYFTNVTGTRFPPAGCNDPNNPFKLGCYTSFLVLSDLDGDGDLDIVFANGGGYYTPNETDSKKNTVTGLESSTVYFNDGTGAFRDATMSDFGDAKSRLRQVAIADVDGDGDMDLYQPGGYGIDNDKLFIQTAPETFVDQAATRLPVGLKSRAGSAHFGDLDGDGDFDLVVGDWGESPRQSPGNTLVYLNDGKGVFAPLLDVVPPPLEPTIGKTPIDMDLADIDGDFDLDILVNHRNGQSRIFLNDGSAHFSDGTAGNYPAKKGPYTYNVEACDFDEDGDLDLLLDNAGGRIAGMGNISQLLVNDGKGKFTDDTANLVTNEPYADDNALKCADVNGDGHYDLLVASLEVPEKLLLNDGTGHFKFSPDAFPNIVDPTLGIDVGDLNGDKKLDVITGQGEATPRVDLFYLGNENVAIDSTPPKFRAVETPLAVIGAPTVMRLAVLDGVTSDTGEHVKSVYLSYTVNGGAAKTVPAKFIGGDLFRAVIPAQPDGSLLEITPTAVDRAGLVGHATRVTLAFGVIPAGEGGAAGGQVALPGAGGEGGEIIGGEPDGGTGPSSGGSGATTGRAGAAGRAGNGGTAVIEGGGAGDDGSAGSATPGSGEDGCGCSLVGQPQSAAPLLASLGLALLAFRRKQSKPR